MIAVRLLTLLALLATPLVAAAQPAGKASRIGVLGAGVNPRSASFYAAFDQRLRELGYIEGQNLAVDVRVPSKGEDLSQTADALVRQRPDVLVVVGPEASMKAARRATRTIPIVMVALNYDPMVSSNVGSGLGPGIRWATESVLAALRGEVPDNVYNKDVIPRWQRRFAGKSVWT